MTDLKTTAGKIEDLDNKLAESRAPLGEGEPAARTRVNQLLDEGSFVETDALARHRSTDFGREHDRPYTDGIVTGYGTIDGRRVCIFSQDATVFDGTMGEVYAEKLTKVYDLALKTGVPIVGIYDSTGPRVQEGIVTLAGYARILARATEASGLIPQISVVAGDTSGIAAFAPTLADVLIVTHGTSLHQAASDVAQAEPDTFGGAAVHAQSGTAQLSAPSEQAALALVRDVLAYLPANNRAEATRIDTREVAEFDLDSVIPDSAADAYDMRAVVNAVVDKGSFFELSAEAAPNIITGFAFVDGRAVGIVANQPLSLGGALDSAAVEKAARFVRLCDAFNTPIIEFVDSPGFVATPAEERAGLLRRAAGFAYAQAEASVGKLTVVTRKAIGPAYAFMGSKDLGADLVYAWPTAEIAVAEAAQTSLAIYGDADKQEEMDELFLHPYAAAERGLADNVIEPSATRHYLVEGLRLLERKVVAQVPKKHGTV
ncbi:acyl-CoA carboxylase subunit beta [Corynebacterium rhinophilum]|uniref:acyl-CoA carboxylase subunit beta n=1 Tax=Corynebacterium rhinophilum TaxID=3050197 RepID=UPI00254BF51E|nr:MULTISPECIES: carboxyl transferase domain-containing protein [unclassified Corynebacterium]MDK8702194.1 carboxyl transferase domain-containing protein [Corynebacterium sp. MSK107]MDK8704008.1 carboxyl transferase domain-containing protein [Corynebacterium sp. MSK090]